MDNLLTVAFEAHHPEKNHHRRYQVTIGRDLLDAWTVAITYGRADKGGRELRFASPKPEDMRAVMRDRLCAEADRSAARGAEPRVIVRRGRLSVAWSQGGRGGPR
jgi:hypothetical protein